MNEESIEGAGALNIFVRSWCPGTNARGVVVIVPGFNAHERAGSPDKTIKLYEGHFHDLLNDLDKELVITDIKRWITAGLSPSKPVAQVHRSEASIRD